jgi:TonB family protein
MKSRRPVNSDVMRNNSHLPNVQSNVTRKRLVFLLLPLVVASSLSGQTRQPKPDTSIRTVVSPNANCVSTNDLNRSLKKLRRKRPTASGCFSTVDLICAACRTGVELDTPPPCYPAIAKSGRAAGRVVVEMVVNETGKVSWARVMRGHPLLRAAALAAALKRTYTPFTCSDKPIKAYAYAVYDFVLP